MSSGVRAFTQRGSVQVESSHLDVSIRFLSNLFLSITKFGDTKPYKERIIID